MKRSSTWSRRRSDGGTTTLKRSVFWDLTISLEFSGWSTRTKLRSLIQMLSSIRSSLCWEHREEPKDKSTIDLTPSLLLLPCTQRVRRQVFPRDQPLESAVKAETMKVTTMMRRMGLMLLRLLWMTLLCLHFPLCSRILKKTSTQMLNRSSMPWRSKIDSTRKATCIQLTLALAPWNQTFLSTQLPCDPINSHIINNLLIQFDLILSNK